MASHVNQAILNPRKERKSYKIAFKIRVIKEVKKYRSIRKIARKYKINRKTVRDWMRNKRAILASTFKRTSSYLKKPTSGNYPALESQLYRYFTISRDRGACLNSTDLKAEAKRLAAKSNVEFKCSNGWFENFLKRKDLVIRRVSSSGRVLPQNNINNIKEFIKTANNECVNKHKSAIFNLDQTSIYLDMPRKQTYAQKGSEKVIVQHTGSVKTRMSVLFSASADGVKLPGLIIIPRANPIPNLQVPANIMVIFRKSGTFNTEVMMQNYIDQILRPHLMKNGIKDPVVFLDKAPCHRKLALIDYCAKHGIKIMHIPAHLTGLLQPADVSWLRTIKLGYENCWTQWFQKDPMAFSKFGNLMSPGYESSFNIFNREFSSFGQLVGQTCFFEQILVQKFS
jgi:transposase-like protein